MKNNLLIIFGKKSSAFEIEEAALLYLSGYSIIKIFYSPDFIEKSVDIQNAIKEKVSISYIISFSDTDRRTKCVSHLESIPEIKPLSIIHPTAYISVTATIGQGSYVAANAVVSSNAILAKHVLVNYNVTVGHDTILESHVSLLPGARVSGNVTIGEGTTLGANSFIFQGLTIGKNNVIDALTSIHKHLEDNMISAARVTKSFKKIKR